MTAPGGWELVTSVDAQNHDLGDLRISGTRIAKIATFGDAVRQAVQVELRWWLGEWFLDRSRGTPYLEKLIGKGVSRETVRAVLKAQIRKVPGVARVLSIDVAIDRTTRKCTVTNVSVLTTESDIPVDIGDVLVGRS